MNESRCTSAVTSIYYPIKRDQCFVLLGWDHSKKSLRGPAA